MNARYTDGDRREAERIAAVYPEFDADRLAERLAASRTLDHVRYVDDALAETRNRRAAVEEILAVEEQVAERLLARIEALLSRVAALEAQVGRLEREAPR